MSFEPIVLAPEETIEKVFPYRRVWRTSWIEAILLFIATSAVWALAALFDALPDTAAPLPRALFALLPLGLWLLVSYRGERTAPQQRQHILAVMVLGALVANGVAAPLEERLYEPDLWLPQSGFFGRILGYTFTMGITTAFLLYLAIRYSVWPDRFTQRTDGIAYGLAAALGFATVYNVRVVVYTDTTLVATALRVASITYAHLAIGALTGFFIAELVIGRVPIFWLPFGLGFSAFVGGLYYAFRAVAIVGGLSIAGTGSSPIRGLGLAFGLVAVVYVVVAFIINNADTRQSLATRRREV